MAFLITTYCLQNVLSVRPLTSILIKRPPLSNMNYNSYQPESGHVIAYLMSKFNKLQ